MFKKEKKKKTSADEQFDKQNAEKMKNRLFYGASQKKICSDKKSVGK